MGFRPDRELLREDRTYYVRTDGSDSNDGLANSSSRAFLTIQKAVDVASSLDLSTSNVTIDVVDVVGGGTTYTLTGAVFLKSFVGNGRITIRGSTGTASDVTVSGNNVNLFVASNTNRPNGTYSIQNLRVTTTTAGSAFLIQESYLKLDGIEFASCATNHMVAASRGHIDLTGSNYTITGGAGNSHAECQQGAEILANAITVTLTGTPAFTRFVNCFRNSTVGYFSTVFSGSATGTRYNAALNGTIFTNGGGANYFPGNAAGTTSTGGVYN